MMRFYIDRENKPLLFRLFHNYSEVAYATVGLCGVCAEIEFPSDWHERPAAWVRLGFGLFKIAFSFPWKWVVPDEYQCSGPQYGFTFFEKSIHLHWGKCKGRRDDPIKIVHLPWDWEHVRHTILNPDQSICCDAKSLKHSWEPPEHVKETHDYTYTLRSGEVQHRKATVFADQREWRWRWFTWLPYPRMIKTCMEIQFDGEVGEGTGSWKGGTVGHSHELKPGETLLECLRRYEKEVKHDR